MGKKSIDNRLLDDVQVILLKWGGVVVSFAFFCVQSDGQMMMVSQIVRS